MSMLIQAVASVKECLALVEKQALPMPRVCPECKGPLEGHRWYERQVDQGKVINGLLSEGSARCARTGARPAASARRRWQRDRRNEAWAPPGGGAHA